VEGCHERQRKYGCGYRQTDYDTATALNEDGNDHYACESTKAVPSSLARS